MASAPSCRIDRVTVPREGARATRVSERLRTLRGWSRIGPLSPDVDGGSVRVSIEGASRAMVEATLEVRASLAQRSGGGGEGLTLEVSPASLAGWAELPEPNALSIGLRPPEPPSRGLRRPHAGTEALLAGDDQALEGEAPHAQAALRGVIRRHSDVTGGL